MRFIALGIFTPLMRNHSAIGTRRQEAYQFDHTERFAALIGIRYALLPYVYSEYMKAALEDEPYFQPLSFVYPSDAEARRVEDQLMLGNEIMIAPVYTQNAKGRYVYLPENMCLVRMKNAEEIALEALEKGHHYVEVAVDEVVFFIRENHMLPLADKAEYVEGIDDGKLRFIAFGESCEPYELYTDDGYCTNYVQSSKKYMLRDGKITDEAGNEVKGMTLVHC
jgi:alpha-glucosidase